MTKSRRKQYPHGESARLAKLTHPTPKGVYERTRLYKLLDQARRCPIVWIAAPGGSGKTTLVASYVQARKLSSLWYQLDQSDSDPASFFYCMGQGAKSLSPKRKITLPLLTPEYRAALPVFTANYFRTLFGSMKIPGVIVLDNYQDAANIDSSLHEIFSQGFEQIPEGINVIILSREGPPAAFARQRANERIALLGFEELKLTEKETTALVALRCKRPSVAREAFQRLHRDTQGWVAGVVLMTEQARGIPVDEFSGTGATQPVFDYFASEIFRRGDQDTQDFLLKTALLPRFSVVLARTLTGQVKSEAILKDLAKRNFFTLKHEEGTYEYHPLFRAFLRAQAIKTYSADELNRLKRQCAQLLSAHGDAQAAISLMQEAQDWLGALSLIQSQAPALAEQGRLQTIETWLDAFPVENTGNPWVLYWKGVCRLAFAPSEARQYFEQAFYLFEPQNDASPLYMAWSGIIESFILESDDFTPMNAWLDRYSTLANGRSPPSLETESESVFTYISGLMRARVDHPDLPVYADKAEMLLRDSVGINRYLVRVTVLFRFHLWKGDCAKVENLLDSLEPYVASPEMTPLSRIYWYFCKMTYVNMTGSPEESNRVATKAFDLMRTSGVHALEFLFFGWLIWKYLTPGCSDTVAARAMLQKMVPFTGRSRIMEASYRLRAATILHHEGNVVRGLEEGVKALRLCEETSFFMETVLTHATLAQLYANSGDFESASVHSEKFREFSVAMQSPFMKAAHSFLQANLLRMQGQQALALQSLEKGLAMEQAMGFVLVPAPWYSSQHVSDLFAMALDADVCTEYVQAVIRKIRLRPPQGYLTERWPWRVRIHTLGRFEIYTEDTSLDFGKKTQRKPLELLRTLVTFGGRDVSAKKLTQIIWPDTEGDTAVKVFEITLHRLRKLLGDEFIELQKGLLSLNPEYCWFDVWAFEGLLEPLGDTVPLSEQAKRLLDVYRGPFIENDDAPSVIIQRERLHLKFLRAIERLGQALEAQGDYLLAVACYQRAIEIDPLAEGCQRRLMHCYRHLKRFTEALGVYQRFHATLAATLGVEPSAETKALYEEIKRSY